MDELGNIVRYNRKKNWFAVGNDKGLFTFYAPRDGRAYFDFFNEEVSRQWRKKEVNAQFADTKIIGSLMIFALYAIGNANQRRKRCQIYPAEPMLCP